jgi:hypothetical protein
MDESVEWKWVRTYHLEAAPSTRVARLRLRRLWHAHSQQAA